MTWTIDIVDGDLVVWRFDQNPDTDAPAATHSSEDGYSWSPDSKGLRDFPNEVFDLMWEASVDYYNDSLADGTVDFTLFRLVAEAALEQIEWR